MKNLLCILLFCIPLHASEERHNDTLPCDDPLLKRADLKGIKSIPLKDILRFKKLVKACENEGGSQKIEKIYEKDWNRDFNSARRMSSWTSTHAMCVFVSFAYYFAGKMFATIPSS